MTRLTRTFLALAALGSTLGLALALVGLPYGRMSPGAFAELYHGPTDTSGTFHVALDCDPSSPGTQSHCAFFASGFPMAVTIGNSTGASVNISSFNFRVTNNRQDLFNPGIGADANLNSNPDFNDAFPPSGWTCTPPPPNRDESPSPLASVSYIGCIQLASPFNTIPLPQGVDHVKLATVVYGGSGPIGPEQTALFTLSDVNVFDDTSTELISCNPVNSVAGPCFNATANWGLPPPPTFPPTPTSTPTAVPDHDGDGIPNVNDNCPQHANAGQENTDANFISNAPVSAVNDLTRANSDGDGDACDPDRDNDGRDNGAEEEVCASATGPTNPLAFDTDGDRVFDGAECGRSTDPTNPASKPTLVACGSSTDADVDGLNERLERCYYNTDPNDIDSDNDGVKDGCEAASLNPDTIVNVADLGLVASEVGRPVPPSQKLVNFDINKDGAYNVADVGLVAARVGKCP